MFNERKTENIVRAHLSQFRRLIDIEEQSSDHPKIAKLLKTASKKGNGKGSPEFIVSYKTNSNLLIIIECKADFLKHASLNKDKFSEYAADGVLLYSAYLSKDYDVLSIAVSGETTDQLTVSHFLQLRNEKKAVPVFGGKLLSAQDYLTGYLQSPKKNAKTLMLY